MDQTTETPCVIGVIGAGAISRIILPMLAPRGIAVSGIFDLNADAARALAAATPGARQAEGLDQLLNNPETAGIYLATPPSSHAALIDRCLAAGKPVIGEKPWVLNEAEARNVAAACAAAPEIVVASCASRFLFSPVVAPVLSVLRGGSLGKIRHVRLRASNGVAKALPDLLPWQRDIATAGGGICMDWGPYDLAWLAGVLGEAFDPESVSAHLDDWRREGTGLESGYTALIRCRSGCVVEVARLSEVGPPRHDVEIRCEHGAIDMPFCPSARDRTARVHRLAADGKTIETTDLAGAADADWPEILAGPLINFARALNGRETVLADAASQVLLHRWLDAILTSGREVRPVRISPP